MKNSRLSILMKNGIIETFDLLLIYKSYGNSFSICPPQWPKQNCHN